MPDLLTWQTRATRYVHAKGWQDPDAEDLIQEMLCYVLQHPATFLNIDYVYRVPATVSTPDGARPRVALET